MLYARRKQLMALSRLRERADRTAQVGLLVGHEGVGKTALVREALERFNGTVLRLKALAADLGVPFSCVHELARRLNVTVAGSVDEMAGTLIDAISAASPATILIDDIHLLDPDSQTVLWQVVRRLNGSNLLLLVTVPGSFWFSDAVAEYVGNGGEHGALIQLDPFTEDEVADYILRNVGAKPERRALMQVMDITGGYPGLVSAFVEILLKVRGIPEALDELMARIQVGVVGGNRLAELIASLGGGERAALIAIAQAKKLTVGQLAHVLQIRNSPPCNVSALERSGFLRVTSEGDLQICHAVCTRTVIEMTAHSDLLDSHRALAEVLVGLPALPHRVEAAAPRDRGELLVELQNHVNAAMAQHDYEAAFDLAALAARIEPDMLLIGALAAIRGARFDLLVRNEKLFRELPASSCRASVLVLLAIEQRDLASAHDQLDNIPLDQFKDIRELMMFGQTLLRLCAAEMLAGCRRLPMEGFTEMSAVFREQKLSDDPVCLAECMGVAAILDGWSRLPAEPRRGYLDSISELQRLYEPGSDSMPVAIIQLILAAVRLAAGDLADAERALFSPDLVKDQELAVISAILLIQIRFWNGDWDETVLIANQIAGRMLDGLRSFAWQQVDSLAALVPLCWGDENSVRGLLVPRPANGPLTFEEVASGLTRAWAGVVNGGDPREIARDLEDAWASGMFEWTATIPTAVLRVRALIAAGDRAAAVRVQDEVRLTQASPPVQEYVQAHIAALLAADELQTAEAARQFVLAELAMEEHLLVNDGQGLRLFEAILAEDWGEFCVVYPDRYVRDVLAAVETAHELAKHCRVRRWEERIADLLFRLGEVGASKGHPMLVDETNAMLNVLTAREREIALLVAQGLSNKEVAARLYITTRTAEYHVHNALTKLGMRSRVELREALRPRSAGPR